MALKYPKYSLGKNNYTMTVLVTAILQNLTLPNQIRIPFPGGIHPNPDGGNLPQPLTNILIKN